MRRLGAAIAVSSVASVAAASKLMFPVPASAITPAHVVVSPGASEQDHFWLEEAYPGASAVDHYGKVFAGWRKCPTLNNGWVSFGEQSSSQARFIHQQLHYWVSKADDTAITLALRYDSQGSTYRIAPDSTRQFVVLLRLKQKNVSKTLAEMGAICAKDS
jgi:hypothetical protein